MITINLKTLKHFSREEPIKPGEKVPPEQICQHDDGLPDTRLVSYEVGSTFSSDDVPDWQDLVSVGTAELLITVASDKPAKTQVQVATQVTQAPVQSSTQAESQSESEIKSEIKPDAKPEKGG